MSLISHPNRRANHGTMHMRQTNPPPVCFAFLPEARKIESAVLWNLFENKKKVLMKKLIITIVALLIMVEHIVAGVVTVSDPGQLSSGKSMALGDTAPFIHIDLTTDNTSDQTVYLTIEQNGVASDMDLFAVLFSSNAVLNTSISNKLTGMQAVLGPFIVKPGQTNGVGINAKINSIKATNSLPVTVRLDLTGVSNSAPGAIEGVLPIQGTSYIVNTNSLEIIQGKITSISLTYNDDENGMYYLIDIEAIADPFRTYSLEHSTNMVSWEEWLNFISPGSSGGFGIDLFLNPTNFPTTGFFRLKSQ